MIERCPELAGRVNPLDAAQLMLMDLALAGAAASVLASLLATRIVPPGPPHPRGPQPHHLFRHHAGGVP